MKTKLLNSLLFIVLCTTPLLVQAQATFNVKPEVVSGQVYHNDGIISDISDVPTNNPFLNGNDVDGTKVLKLGKSASTGTSFVTNAVIPFKLPARPLGESVNAANLKVNIAYLRHWIDANVDLYGLPYNASATINSSDYYDGTYADPTGTVTAIQSGFIVRDTGDTEPLGTQIFTDREVNSNSSGDTALIAYINAQYVAGAVAGDYIFLRLSINVSSASSPNGLLGAHYYGISDGQTAKAPVLTIGFTSSPVTNTWNGGSTDWATPTNWSEGTIPTALENVVIPDLVNDPIIGATTGAVANDITTNGVLTIASGGSLIVSGTATGDITYQVASNDTNWHLLSSPTLGAAYNGTWITDNDIDDTTRAVGTNVAIGTYTNTVDADGDWSYATDAANSGTFETAQGYSIKKDATTNAYISFTGSIKTNNLTSSIDKNVNNWNLKGNPYPSYILVSDLISDNTANLTDTHEAVYIFDNNKAGGAGYTALTGTDYIHPGQGYFLNADNSNADNFTIDASKLSHQTGKTLYKGVSNTSIKLFIEEDTKKLSTEINYLNNKTTGLDPGFDIGTFTGEATNFNIYTQLVTNNNGVNFLRQALPNTDLESMIIPVGVKAKAGKEITFSTEALNLPSGLKVFLEDRNTNTFTRLDEANTNYKITLTKALNGTGRFYLHIAQSALSVDTNIALKNVSIYKTNNSTLRIVGLQQGQANVKVFNILGKQVLNTTFTSNGAKDISLPKLAKGVYVIQLSTEAGKLNKKIILE